MLMSRTVLHLAISILGASCYTEIKPPNYHFMRTVKQQAALDSSLKTTILLSPKNYSFGAIKASGKLVGSFKIINKGSIDFNIVSLNSNCNYIKTFYGNVSTIHPHDSLIINYEINTAHIKGTFKNTIIAVGNCQYGNQTYCFEGFLY